ncbi:hypothetical protein [Halosimplex pelagicum]|uniref:Uncharacterized protein n=1 Tax=Halosimplex pelagicum TaxID=869886 RepID=A0A7D5P801_9EURY|nr:hypothetical protein [Halosimplex pelagicum]QLH81501.1 hypothetical protein HZS54_07615 [Halosimplex pelagicum]
MVDERRIVTTDLLGGFVTLAIGLRGPDLDPLASVWWTGVLALLALGGTYYGLEHGPLERVTHGWFVLLAVEATVFVAAVLASGQAIDTVLRGVFVGSGAGQVVYRFAFGVVRPVPQRRLARAVNRF